MVMTGGRAPHGIWQHISSRLTASHRISPRLQSDEARDPLPLCRAPLPLASRGRLEFLGDAVLEFLTSHHIYCLFEDEEEVRAAEDDDDVEDEAEGTSGAPSRAAATAAPAATARGGGRGSGVSAAKAPAAVGWTVDEFLANQSDSDDSEDTKVAKRRKRNEMKQKLREARERA